MRQALVIAGALILLIAGSTLRAQTPASKCSPQLIKPAPSHPKANTSFGDYKRAPVVSFDVDQHGTVARATIKRSSGSAAADDLALSWVKSLKYKPLRGCEIVQSEATVIIDFAP